MKISSELGELGVSAVKFIPTALIRWRFGLDYPAEIFPMGGSDEVDAAIRERLASIQNSPSSPFGKGGKRGISIFGFRLGRG